MTLHYNMHNETLFLAVYYMDRFMTIRTGVERAYLQLIAIACLTIAAKIEVPTIIYHLHIGNISTNATGLY